MNLILMCFTSWVSYQLPLHCFDRRVKSKCMTQTSKWQVPINEKEMIKMLSVCGNKKILWAVVWSLQDVLLTRGLLIKADSLEPLDRQIFPSEAFLKNL